MARSSTSSLEIERPVRQFPNTSLKSMAFDLWTLTKPEVNLLIAIATFAGFYLGVPKEQHPFPFGKMANVLCGTLLVAAGAAALNQCREYRFDALMRRTSRRPVAAGRVLPSTARAFGISLSVSGVAYLFVAINPLASGFAVLTLASYLLIYTPLKRRTPLCTVVGAFPGAIPPLIGWAAASESIANPKPWVLYALLFLRQLPHFMAIAFMYRDDYARAGYIILPAGSERRFLVFLTVVPAIAMVGVSFVAVMVNGGSALQYMATMIVGLGFLGSAAYQIRLHTGSAARRLLNATIVYLPIEFLVLVVGKH